MNRSLDEILRAIDAGEKRPVYLIVGEQVVSEAQATRVAEALAKASGCEVERHRRPAELGSILADLKTYSLFASAKVVLVVDAAILADEKAAAALIDQTEDVLPLDLEPGEELSMAAREAASRLLQALRVFGIDPRAGTPDGVLGGLPDWAFKGGPKYRKGHPRGRKKKDVTALKKGLEELLAGALEAGLTGFAESDLAELGGILKGGLPEGHALVLAETAVSREHPLVASLQSDGAAIFLDKVEASRDGDWQGLAPLVAELERETGAAIARNAVPELARRTLKQKGDFKSRQVDPESTSRFAAEYRKLASLAGRDGITRQLVEESVEDRGEQDVFQILDALGYGRGGESLDRLRRYLSAADDPVGARLRFFSLLARFCRQLVAIAGLVQLQNMPWGEGNYRVFKDRFAPRLQGELLEGLPSPLAGAHPYQLHRAYLTASSICRNPRARVALSELPSWVLETELRLKGEASDGDAALVALLGRIVQLQRA